MFKRMRIAASFSHGDSQSLRFLISSRLMHNTSLSLLDRLRTSREVASWKQFEELYASLIRAWLRRYDVQDSDAEDLVQEVLLAVSNDLDRFEHAGRPGAFRAWLKSILINRLRKFWRTRDRSPQAGGGSDMDAKLAQLDDPASEMTLIWNQDHDRHALRHLLALAEPHFEATTWRAFSRVALEGAKPDEVAEELGISRNAVVVAKCRVLNRLRQESTGLIESASGFFGKS